MTHRTYDSVRLALLDRPGQVGALRQEAGLSALALSRLSGVPEAVISQVERGIREDLSNERINQLARALTAEACAHCGGTGRVNGIARAAESASSAVPAGAPVGALEGASMEEDVPTTTHVAVSAGAVSAEAAAESAPATSPTAPQTEAGSGDARPAGGRPDSYAAALERLEAAIKEGRIGQIVVEIREQSGENRRAFAARAGVAAHALVDLERGKSRSTSAANLDKLARAWAEGPASPVPRRAASRSSGRTAASPAAETSRAASSRSPAAWSDDDDDLLSDPEATAAPRPRAGRGHAARPAPPPAPAAAPLADEEDADSVRAGEIFRMLTDAVTGGNVGSELRRLRRRLNLPQQLLARRAGVEPKLVRDLESGARTRPGEAALKSLSRALAEEMAPKTSGRGRRRRA